MDIYKEYLRGNIGFEELLLEAQPDKYWIAPDGEIIDFGDSMTHKWYVESNPDKFRISKFTAPNPVSDAFQNGAIRFSKIGPEGFVMFSDDVTRDAFNSVQEITKGLRKVSVDYVDFDHNELLKTSGSREFSVDQFTEFRNAKAVINRIKNGGEGPSVADIRGGMGGRFQ